LFQLADQPLQMTVAVTEDEAEFVLRALRSERIHLLYVRFPVEFGILGDESPSKKAKVAQCSTERANDAKRNSRKSKNLCVARVCVPRFGPMHLSSWLHRRRAFSWRVSFA
jgi:hypothetical protein